MKKGSGNKMRLGVFVSTGIALFIAGIYFVGKRQQLFSTTFRVSGVFKDISGLEVGNNVRFSGINVGIIEDIEQITDSTVRVDMVINEHTRKFIKKNAKAIIGSDGLMGNKIVLIIPGTSGEKELSDNDAVETAQQVSMDDILRKIKVTSDNSANITDDLAAIMYTIRSGKGTIGKFFMDTIFAQTIDDAFVNIKQRSGGFKKNMEAAKEAIVNIKEGAGGFNQNMEAAKHNFLLKGYFNKKKKAADAKNLEVQKAEDINNNK